MSRGMERAWRDGECIGGWTVPRGMGYLTWAMQIFHFLSSGKEEVPGQGAGFGEGFYFHVTGSRKATRVEYPYSRSILVPPMQGVLPP